MIETVGILYAAFFVIVGTVFYSFLNVVVYRVPRHISFVKGRSCCPDCGRQLKAYDMIPVLSWFLLKGRCRFCHEKISPRYPFLEACGGAAALICLIRFGSWNGFWNEWNLQATVMFAAFFILTAVAWIDIDTMEIPNGLVIGLLIVGICSGFVFSEIGILPRVIGFFSVSLPLFIMTLFIPGAFGGGDIKLMAAAGVLLGWKMSLVAFFIAILTGGFYGIYLLTVKKKTGKEKFAFGPYLCLGIAAAAVFGERLLNWYLNLVLWI